MPRVTLPEGLLDRTVECAIDDLSRADPQRGYRFQEDDGTERLISFPEMERESARVAGALQSIGARPGDRVILVLTKNDAFVRTFLGAIRAGLIPAPVSPPLGLGGLDRFLDGVAHLVAQSGAKLLVTEPRIGRLLEGVRGRCPGLTLATVDSLRGDGSFRAVRRSMEDVCFLQFTSGSTARPRGVVIRDRNLTANLRSMTQAFGDLGLELEVDQAVSWLPLFHDMGLGFVMMSLYIRNPLVLLPSLTFLKRPRRWLEAISRHRAAVSFAPNFAYAMCARRLEQRDIDGLDLSCWKVAGCGAEPIRGRDLEAFARRLAPAGFDARALTCAYGLAEAVVAVAFSALGAGVRLDAVDADALSESGRADPVAEGKTALQVPSCGEPLEGMHLGIFAPDDQASEQPLGEREVGELRIRGPSVTSGYWGDERASAELFAGEWLRTGDLGYLAGGCVHVCGRLKEMMIVHGHNYYPKDVEWVASSVEGVYNDMVVAFATQTEGESEGVVIALETTESDPVAQDRIARTVKRRVYDSLGLAVAEVVALARGALPKTSSGKLMRYRARELHVRGALREEPSARVASRIETMRRLLRGQGDGANGSGRDPRDSGPRKG